MPCDECYYANWKKTKNGRLHPDKTGRCTFVWKAPELPKAFYFYQFPKGEPIPTGGYIERGDPKTDGCKYFGRR